MTAFKNFNPSQVQLSIGGIKITGLAARDDAISFSSNEPPMGLTAGLNSFARTIAAAVTYNMRLTIVATDPSCTLINAIRTFIQYGSSSGLPAGFQSTVGAVAGALLIPISFIPVGGQPYFEIVSSIWAQENTIDVDAPYVGSDNFYRTFNFRIADEIFNQLGQLATN